MEYVYVLRLEGGKWYVGKTTNLRKRIENHFKGKGSQWTAIHLPIAVQKVTEGSKTLENFLTVKLMSTYGIANVRGGNWTKPILSSRKISIATACVLRYSNVTPHPARSLHYSACPASLVWRLVHPLRDGDYKG